MITLELSKRNWNTKYLRYDPKKYLVEIVPHINKVNIEAWCNGGKERCYGYFDSVRIRTTDIPPYVSKSDIEVWD